MNEKIINFIKKSTKKILQLSLFPFITFDYIKFIRNEKRFTIKLKDIYSCVLDKTTQTHFDAHYIYHTSWAARKLKSIHPSFHIDISSSLFFVGIASAFVPINFYDYRPAYLKLSNLQSSHADLTNLNFSDSSIQSLSCMHTIEHIGLGRYGDPIDNNGDLKAISELKRVLSVNGSLLFVVPVGAPRIQYNAHRIYSFEMIQEYFKDLTLKEFTLINDDGDYIENADPDMVQNQKYACGCFWFIKQ